MYTYKICLANSKSCRHTVVSMYIRFAILLHAYITTIKVFRPLIFSIYKIHVLLRSLHINSKLSMGWEGPQCTPAPLQLHGNFRYLNTSHYRINLSPKNIWDSFSV